MTGQQDEEMALLIKVDKRPISQAQLIGFALVVVTQTFIAGGLYYKFTTLATDAASKADFALLTNKVESQEAVRTSRAADLDKSIDDIRSQLKPLATIELRLDQNDKRDDAQDARLDRFTDVVTNTMELIRKDVGGLGTKVEVMSNKIDNLSQAKKAEFGTPPELIR